MEESKMKDNNCIFCKIANGEIPSATIYEDESFRVILDLGPASKGHALILPKEHFKDICELEDSAIGSENWYSHEKISRMCRF